MLPTIFFQILNIFPFTNKVLFFFKRNGDQKIASKKYLSIPLQRDNDGTNNTPSPPNVDWKHV
jgi:hypothetical protein